MLRESFCEGCPIKNTLCEVRKEQEQITSQELIARRIDSFLQALEIKMKNDYKTAYKILIVQNEDEKPKRKTKKKKKDEDNKNYWGIRRKLRCIRRYLIDNENANIREKEKFEIMHGKGYLLEVLFCEWLRYLMRSSTYCSKLNILLAFPEIDFANLIPVGTQGGDILILYEKNPIALIDVTQSKVIKTMRKLEVGKFYLVGGSVFFPIYNIALGLLRDQDDPCSLHNNQESNHLCYNILTAVKKGFLYQGTVFPGEGDFLFSEDVLTTADRVFREKFVQSILTSHQISFNNGLMRHTGRRNTDQDLEIKSLFFIEKFVNHLRNLH